MLRGAGDTRVPMVISVVAFWMVMMPLCYVLGFRTRLGAVGLWYGLVGGLGAVAVLLLLRIYQRFGRDLQRVNLTKRRPPARISQKFVIPRAKRGTLPAGGPNQTLQD